MKVLNRPNIFFRMYGYLFYKTYSFMKEPRFKNNGLQYVVVLAMTCFACENILFVSSLYDLFMDRKIFDFFVRANNFVGYLFVPALLLNYFLFIYNDGYQQIFEYYKNRSGLENKVGDFWAWAYIFFSMFGLILIEPIKVILVSIF